MFAPPEGYNFTGPRRPRGLGAVGGMAVGADQLVVGDGRRLVFWNDLGGLASGQAADGLVAAEAFSSPEAWQGRMAVDDAGRLWSLRAEGVDVFAMPLTAVSRPLARIMPAGQAIPVLGGGDLVLGRYRHGLAVVGAGRAVWIADPANHRVVRIRHPLEAPVVDVVLGQLGPGPGTCNRGLEPPPNVTGREVLRTDVLCYPGAVSVDKGGNVYVSDHTVEAEGNWRMLVFLAATVPEGLREPIYGPEADRVFPYRTLQPGATFEAAFDSGNRMAVGYNAYLAGRYRYGRFIGIYFDPLDPRSLPDTHLRDLTSLPWTLRFDAHDNLFVADTNRHRVLVYWRPLGPFRRHPVAKAVLPWTTADGGARRGGGRDS